MAKPVNRIISPSIPVLVRALQECDPAEYMVVAAVQAIHWVLDADEEAGLDMLCRAMPRVGRRTIQRAIDRLRSRVDSEGQPRPALTMDRRFGRPSRFAVHFDDMTFRQLRQALQLRQDGADGIEAKLARMTGQDGADDQAKLARILGNRDFKRLTSKRETKRLAPQAPPSTSQEQALALLDPAYSARYRRTLTRNADNIRDAAELDRLLGADLLPAWTAFLADPGRNNKLIDSCHPLAWLLKTIDSYRGKAHKAQPKPTSKQCPACVGTGLDHSNGFSHQNPPCSKCKGKGRLPLEGDHA